MAELGAGGGKGDLDQQHELEVGDIGALGMLMSLCATKMQDQPELLSSVMQMLASIMRDPVRAITLDSAALHPEQPDCNQDEIAELEQMPLDCLIPALVDLASKAGRKNNEDVVSKAIRPERGGPKKIDSNLPKRIVGCLEHYASVSTTFLTMTYADLPLLPPLLLHRTLPPDRSLQTSRHLALHRRQSQLVRVSVDDLSLRTPLRRAMQVHT